jgi:hypothetical protein
MRPRPNLDGVARSGPTRGWCAAARKPTFTTGWHSLCEVAHRARGKVTIIFSEIAITRGNRRTHWFAWPPMHTPRAMGASPCGARLGLSLASGFRPP